MYSLLQHKEFPYLEDWKALKGQTATRVLVGKLWFSLFWSTCDVYRKRLIHGGNLYVVDSLVVAKRQMRLAGEGGGRWIFLVLVPGASASHTSPR